MVSAVLRIDLGEGARPLVLEDSFREPSGSERDEAHQDGHDVLSLLRERPSDQFGGVVCLDPVDHLGVLELTQPKGEHAGREARDRPKEGVEPVGPFPTDVTDDEQAPLPTEDPEARRDRAVLARNDGHGWLDRSACHGDPWIVERMGLRALKEDGRTVGDETRSTPAPRQWSHNSRLSRRKTIVSPISPCYRLKYGQG